MSNIIELSAHRRDRDQELFDAHRSALVELVCAFAVHAEGGDQLDRLEAAQDEFVRARQALNA
jgi:hypothetical protein